MTPKSKQNAARNLMRCRAKACRHCRGGLAAPGACASTPRVRPLVFDRYAALITCAGRAGRAEKKCAAISNGR